EPRDDQIVVGADRTRDRAAGREAVVAHAEAVALHARDQAGDRGRAQAARAHRGGDRADQRAERVEAAGAVVASEGVILDGRGVAVTGDVRDERVVGEVGHGAPPSPVTHMRRCATARWRTTRTWPAVMP